MAKGKWKSTLLAIQGIVGHKNAPDWSFLYEHSTIKNPNYNIGDRVVLPDGRVFRYGKCHTTFANMKLLCYSLAYLVAQKGAGCVIATGGAAVEDKKVTLTVTPGLLVAPGEEHDAGTGVIAEDELRGGYISFYGSSSDRQQRGIIGNTALTALGTSITIYLDASVTVAMNAAVQCEILPNPYSSIRNNANNEVSALGLPNAVAAANEYFWIQTWGISRVTPQSSVVGVLSTRRQVQFMQGGVVQQGASYSINDANKQHLGFIVEHTASTADLSSAPFINLQINP